jgi:hypothetical protein
VGNKNLGPNRTINVGYGVTSVVLLTHATRARQNATSAPTAAPRSVSPSAAGSERPEAGPPPPPKVFKGDTTDFVATGARHNRADSFHAMVAQIRGGDSSDLYGVDLTGFEMRKEGIDTEKEVAMYIINVSNGGQRWTIYRRFAQFEKLDKQLKGKKLLEPTDGQMPKKSQGAEANVPVLKNYVSYLISHPVASTHYYLHNFLEPLQMGDVRHK